MKIEKNDKYFTIAAYSVISILIVLVAALAMCSIQNIWRYFCLFMSSTWDLLKPLTIGFVIAYLLDPLVGFYEKKCKRPYFPKSERVWATLMMSITVIAFWGLFILILSMNIKTVLGSQTIENFSTSMNRYVTYFETLLGNVSRITQKLNLSDGKTLLITQLYTMVNGITFTVTNKILSILPTLGENLLNIGLGVVIALYLLADKKKLLMIWNNILNKSLTRRIGREICSIGRDVDYVFSGYIRGQLIDASLMAGLITLALTLIKLDFAIIIGIIAGIFNIIPYFGPLVGLVLAGLIGAIGPDPQKGLYAALAVLALQQIDGWFIVPKIMGDSVKIHPIVVLLAIVIGGKLFGLLGILLGVPIAAFFRLLIIRYYGNIFSPELK